MPAETVVVRWVISQKAYATLEKLTRELQGMTPTRLHELERAQFKAAGLNQPKVLNKVQAELKAARRDVKGRVTISNVVSALVESLNKMPEVNKAWLLENVLGQRVRRGRPKETERETRRVS